MCRIAGLWDVNNRLCDPKSLIIAMRDSLAHGGPDHAGIFEDSQQGIYLGHRRLAILDPSPAGNQPYIWDRYVLIYNGEVYNFGDIKKEMPNEEFSSESDTEVIIKSWHKWGMDSIKRFRGMFTFAIYDRQETKLFIVRDRLGVKPLFYYHKDNIFLFGSELKALMQYKDLDKTVDLESVALYFKQGYISSPNSIFKNVKKIVPGTILEISKNGDVKNHTYWDARDQYQANESYQNLDEEEWKRILKKELLESFQYRMVSDVPVGMFLSGGIDSSLVTSMLQSESNTQLKTFTIGFDDPTYNEAGYAKEVAQHIGTDHTEWIIGETDYNSVLPKIAHIFDEPNGDFSIIPTYLVSQLAKEQVKVSLSADGGDEFFGGYTKYDIMYRFYPKIASIPAPLRRISSKIIDLVDPYSIENKAKFIPILKEYKNFGSKLLKFSNALRSDTQIEFFHQSSCFLNDKELAALTGHTPERLAKELPTIDTNRSISFWGLIDVLTYMEGDILTKVDRATMQNALEGREPLLDHQLFELAMQIPDHLKIKDNKPKYLLREILYDYVPKKLIDRPKQGFSIPIEKWLRNELKEEIDSMILDDSFFSTFALNSEEVKKKISFFYNKNVNPTFVWYSFVLYRWYQTWFKK